MVNLFESQLISILIDKISKLQKGKIDEVVDFTLHTISGSFLDDWELQLPICNNVKIESVVDGYLFTPEFSSQSFKIITNLCGLDIESLPKEVFLKYSAYKYPILYNGHIIDLEHHILGHKFDYGSLRLIHYAADDSNLEIELKRNFDIFITDVLPNVKDLIVEFGDSIESEVTYEVCNVLDRSTPISNYESISLFDIKVPKQVPTISSNAFNYFKSGLVYQIENMLLSEKLDIKIGLITERNNELIRLYHPITKTKISQKVLNKSYGATGSYATVSYVDPYGEVYDPYEDRIINRNNRVVRYADGRIEVTGYDYLIDDLRNRINDDYYDL